jgi:hypothetical protein
MSISIINTDAQLAAKLMAVLNAVNAGDIIFTDNTYDIGKSGATRPRDLFLSRNGVVGGTLGVTGVVTGAAFASGTNVSLTSFSVVALSASDVNVGPTVANSFVCLGDITTSGNCLVLYSNTNGVNIVSQKGPITWTVSAPGAGEIQIKDLGGGQMAIRCGATRNNDSIKGAHFAF